VTRPGRALWLRRSGLRPALARLVSDGRWLALVSGNDQLAVGVASFGNKGPAPLSSSGGWRAAVAVTDNAALNVSPVWTPDSRHLLFVSDRDGGRMCTPPVSRARHRSRQTCARDHGPERAHRSSLSADGTRLAYAAYTSHAQRVGHPDPTDGPVSWTALRSSQPATRPWKRWHLARRALVYFDSGSLGEFAHLPGCR